MEHLRAALVALAVSAGVGLILEVAGGGSTIALLVALAVGIVGLTAIELQMRRPGFPRLKFEVRVQGVSTENPAVIFFPVRITNMERGRKASVTIHLHAATSPDGPCGGWWQIHGPFSLSPPHVATPIPTTLTIEPNATISGDLIYDLAPGFAEGIVAQFDVEDHVSGKHVAVPAQMGIYDRKTWTRLDYLLSSVAPGGSSR